MRWLSYVTQRRASYGVLVPESDGEVFDLGALADAPATLKDALNEGATDALVARADASPRLALDALKLLPVIPKPDKILCVGLNYRSHQEEMGRGGEGFPTIFTRFASSQVGHGQPLLRPLESETLDFEGEIAVVIGRSGRRIPTGNALEHLFGVSIYNDGSVREYQRQTSQFTPGKNFPSTGAFGPWLVTLDEIPNLDALTLTTRLNGEEMQRADSSQMVHGFAEIIEYCSRFTELVPGDVLVTGTPGGVGAARKPPVFMDAGDFVEVEVSGIGTLSNPVAVG